MKRRRVRLISVLQPFHEPPVKGILIPDRLCRQLPDVRKNKVVKGSGLNLMAGADLAAEAVIGLADIVGLIDGFPLRFRRPTFSYRACMDLPQSAQYKRPWNRL